MNDRIEATVAILATLLLLFTAVLDPRVSAGLAILLLTAFAAYKLIRRPSQM